MHIVLIQKAIFYPSAIITYEDEHGREKKTSQTFHLRNLDHYDPLGWEQNIETKKHKLQT